MDLLTLSFESKKKLLESARIKLKDQTEPGLKDIFFKSDLTKKQRAEAFAKRESRRKEKRKGRRSSTEPVEKDSGDPFQGSQS